MLRWFKSLPKTQREHSVIASIVLWWIPTALMLFWMSSNAEYEMLRNTEQGIRDVGDVNGKEVVSFWQPEEIALSILLLAGPVAHVLLYSYLFGESEDEQPKTLSRKEGKRFRREARKQKGTTSGKPPRRRRRNRKNHPPS